MGTLDDGRTIVGDFGGGFMTDWEIYDQERDLLETLRAKPVKPGRKEESTSPTSATPEPSVTPEASPAPSPEPDRDTMIESLGNGLTMVITTTDGITYDFYVSVDATGEFVDDEQPRADQTYDELEQWMLWYSTMPSPSPTPTP